MLPKTTLAPLAMLLVGNVAVPPVHSAPPVVEIRTGSRVIRIEPASPPGSAAGVHEDAESPAVAPSPSRLVRPSAGSPVGFALLARSEANADWAPLPVRLENGVARFGPVPTGSLALRFVNEHSFGVAVSLHVNGLPAAFDTDEHAAFVPAGEVALLECDRLARGHVAQLTVVLRTATRADEPVPHVDPVGPAQSATLVGFSTVRAPLVRLVGRTPISAISAIVEPHRDVGNPQRRRTDVDPGAPVP